MTRTCSDCPAPISEKNCSGRCRPCTARRVNADPAVVARRKAAIAARFAEPGVREAYAERRRQRNAEPSQVEREARRRQGRKMAATLTAAARGLTREQRAENGRKRTATTLAWCPEEWRDTYRSYARRGMRAAEAKRGTLDLIAGKPRVKYAQQLARLAWCPDDRRGEYRSLARSVGAAEARRMIEADMALAERRRLAALSYEDRIAERLANGATVTVVRPMPRREHAFSLTGSCSA